MYFPIIDVLKENFIAKIPSIVTQWLTDNVDPVGSAVVVDTSLSISGAAADAKVTGDEISDLKSDLNSMDLIESPNVISTIETGHFYNKSGSHQSSGSYDCTPNIIHVTEGDVLRFYFGRILSETRYITAYSNGSAVSASGAEYTSSYTVPSGIDGVRISWQTGQGTPMLTINQAVTSNYLYFDPYYKATDKFLGDYKEGRSANVLDTSTITDGKYINNTTGSMGTSNSYAVSDYIKVHEGDIVILRSQESNVVPLRYVSAYNDQKKFDGTKGADSVNSYTVPSGISYIRVSADIREMYNGSKGARIFLNGVDEKWQDYFDGSVNELAQINYTGISKLYNYPLTYLPKYFVNAMAYRPLGKLSKGYVCLVSDDGDEALATYTIPMLISKDVPCTFAVMKSSTCWDNSTKQATVIDAVINHKCEIAQHGGTTWDQYDEYTLNRFFDTEKEFWNTLNLVPYGAVCPAHIINNLIRVVCGGRFGCLRTGYANSEQYYTGYTNGERSNQYGLTSVNVVDYSLAEHKIALDNTLNNNWLRMIHWHENALTADNKATLEGVIDYAKSLGLTFITMKDIPTII